MVSSRRGLCERRLGAGPESVIAITCTTGGSRPATASSAGSTANSARHRGSAAGSGWSSPSARSGVIAASGRGVAGPRPSWLARGCRRGPGRRSLELPCAARSIGRLFVFPHCATRPTPPTSFQPSSALTRCGSGSTVSRPRKTPAPSVARPSRSMVVGDQEEFGDGQSHVLCAPYLPRSPWTDRAMSCLMNHDLVLSRSHPTTFRPAASWLVLGSVAALDLRAEGPSALLAQASAAHH